MLKITDKYIEIFQIPRIKRSIFWILVWLRNYIQEPRLHLALPERIVSAQVYVWALAAVYLSSPDWFLIAKWKDFYLQTHNFPAELETAILCVYVR